MIKRIIAIALTIGVIFFAWDTTLSEKALSKREPYLIITNEKGETVTSKQLRDMYMASKATNAGKKEFEDKVFRHYRIKGRNIMFNEDKASLLNNQTLLQASFRYNDYHCLPYDLTCREGKATTRKIWVVASNDDVDSLDTTRSVVFVGVITDMDDDNLKIESEMTFNND